MVGIDVGRITYEVAAETPVGWLPLDASLQTLEWEEAEGELAQRLSLVLRNDRVSTGGWLHDQLQLAGVLYVYADWGEGRREVFRGHAFQWEYDGDDDLRLTCYDPLVFLARSRDDAYYPDGTTAATILRDLAARWSLPLAPFSGLDVPLAQQVWRGVSVGQMVLDTLEAARKRGAGDWVLRARAGVVEVVPAGNNSPVYSLRHEHLGSLSHRRDIERLVTRVKVLGQQADGQATPVVAVLDGDLQFGTLQEVVYSSDADTSAAAHEEAQQILQERGQPQESRRITAPDLPFLRRGEHLHVEAGTLSGIFVVRSVRHDALNGQMVVEL